MGSVAAAHGFNCPVAIFDLSAPTRDQIPTPCIASQILNHWTTREIHSLSPFFFAKSSELCYPLQDTHLLLVSSTFPSTPTRSLQQLICAGIKIHNLLSNSQHFYKNLLIPMIPLRQTVELREGRTELAMVQVRSMNY